MRVYKVKPGPRVAWTDSSGVEHSVRAGGTVVAASAADDLEIRKQCRGRLQCTHRVPWLVPAPVPVPAQAPPPELPPAEPAEPEEGDAG